MQFGHRKLLERSRRNQSCFNLSSSCAPRSGRCGKLRREFALAVQRATKDLCLTLDIIRLGTHIIAGVALGHQAHFICHPLAHDIGKVPLDTGRIIAAMDDSVA